MVTEVATLEIAVLEEPKLGEVDETEGVEEEYTVLKELDD